MRVFAVILLLIASFSLALAASKYRLAAETSHLPVCGDEKMEKHLREIMLGALDVALHNHINHLFENWMKDYSAAPSPARAAKGVQNGTAAYIHSLNALQKWNLPRC